MAPLRRAPSGNGVDLLAAIGLAGVSAAFLLTFPHYLGDSDEGLILYEAKRLLAGDVYFRDVFDIIPPGSQYLVAGAFQLLGTTVTTARELDAAIQALITALVYACCRTAGVRRPLAALTAVLQPVLFWPVWPFVSPHWMSTLLLLALLWVALRRPWSSRPARAAGMGVILGAMALVQHQRAAVASVVVVLLLAADALVGRRFGEYAPFRIIARRIAACAAAVVLVAVPPFVALGARAGLQPMVRALVVHPLMHYRTMMRPPQWGAVLMTYQFGTATIPAILRWLPAALIGVATVGSLRWCWRDRLQDVRVALSLCAVGGAAVASSLYFPDLVHLAFIAPIGAVAAAVTLEWGAQRSERRWPASARATTLAAIVVTALLGWRGAQLRRAAWGRVATSAPTAFGAVDFGDARYARLVEAINRLAANDPDRRLFCYPGLAALYLMTGTRNPTPLQIISPGYSFDDQVADALDVVEHQRAPLVVLIPTLVWRDDPIRRLLAQHYRRVPDQPFLWEAAPSA